MEIKMSNDVVYLTKDGLLKLKDELKELTEVKRPEVAQKIKTARELGDISENTMYDAAKNEQAFVEGRITELNDILKKAVVLEEGSSNGVVGVGCRVTVHIEGDEEEFHVVGAPEASALDKKISIESPLGLALSGKKVGDEVTIEAPVGKLTYKILKVE